MVDQESLNQIFKELFNLGTLSAKDPGELSDLFVYYSQKEAYYISQFQNVLMHSEDDVRLLNRFISRLSEAYQILMAKKQICRSKASTFVPTIYNCLTQMYDGKSNIMVLLTQAIFQECKLQLEILCRKLHEGDVKRIHSQDNEETLALHSQYYSMHIGQRKVSIPDWQLNVKVNKTLNNYYNKTHQKLYDVVGLEKNQEDQFVYYQSRDQNMERLFNQLMDQNSTIKKSVNWAQNIDPEKYQIKIDRKIKKIQEICNTPSIQDSTQSSPIKQSKPIIKKTAVIFSPSKKQKQRSISSNGPHDSANTSLHVLNPSILNLQKLIQLPVNKVQIEFKTRSMPFNVLKRKMLFDLLPLHNSKLKNKFTKNYMQI